MAEKQLNMRISEDLKAQFDEAVKASGMSQADYFAMLMSTVSADELKAMVPEIATEIDAVRAHLDSVMDAYKMAVKRSTEAYEIASDKVRGQLEALGTLTNDNKRLTEENKQLSLDLASARDEIKRLSDELAKAQAIASETEDMRTQLTEAREKIVTMREQHQEAIDRERRESHEELMDALVKVFREHAK